MLAAGESLLNGQKKKKERNLACVCPDKLDRWRILAHVCKSPPRTMKSPTGGPSLMAALNFNPPQEVGSSACLYTHKHTASVRC